MLRALLLCVLCLACVPAALASGGEQKEAGPSIPGGGAFAEMDPIILPIVDGGRVVQSVTILVTLDVPEPADAARARALKPKLTDAFLSKLYAMLNDPAAQKAGTIPTQEIKAELLVSAQKIMGTEHVRGILLQVVQQRPI